MVINENINDKIMDEIFTTEKFKLSVIIKFLIPKKLTAAKVGIDSRKDIFAESNLSKLSILAAVIVIPDLLTPGIKANI
tara:strand:+ start:583 stop:819 length:237 start_codon:yes stop_codon:yes gene_type:complete